MQMWSAVGGGEFYQVANAWPHGQTHDLMLILIGLCSRLTAADCWAVWWLFLQTDPPTLTHNCRSILEQRLSLSGRNLIITPLCRPEEVNRVTIHLTGWSVLCSEDIPVIQSIIYRCWAIQFQTRVYARLRKEECQWAGSARSSKNYGGSYTLGILGRLRPVSVLHF